MPHCVEVRILGANGSILARFVSWPEPLKFLQFANNDTARLKIDFSHKLQEVRISAQAPVKGLMLKFEPEAFVSDNGIDLMPGDEQVISTRGLTARTQVTWRYLGDEHVSYTNS
ncbi:hypothetical protein OIV83_001362 [Microbotryomycetes sp. JL201]|nr:hypothetical protein OIV83_001362 [Microbotryomycetes sp. JL201]